MIRVTGDHRAPGDDRSSAVDLTQLPPPAEDELDLALADVQPLERPRQPDDGRFRAPGVAGVRRAAGDDDALPIRGSI